MISRIGKWIIASAVAIAPAAGGTAYAQNQPVVHHHYKLIDMGTLGGPNSFSAWPNARNINSQGTAIAEAETAFGDPYAPNCLQAPDCLVSRGISWHNGVQTDMGALLGGNNSSFPFWINDLGEAVGISNNNLFDALTGYPETRATLWKGGKILDLGTLGGNASLANAINNRGQVVGVALNAIPDSNSNGLTQAFIAPFFFPVATQNRAFLWQNGVMQDLGTLGSGKDAAAFFVNDLGQVSGVSFTDTITNATTGNPTQDPFFWENGKMVDIGTLGGTSGGPWFMNSLGQVVGNSNLAGDQATHAFAWDRKNGLKDLGVLPGGSGSIATWINDSGEIVGQGGSSSGFHGILWKGGKTIDLGELAGDCYSEALGINSQGQIIGNSSPDCGTDGVAVLWENGGAPINMNTLVTPVSSVNVAFPVNINDRGEIVAHGVLPNGDVHAFLLIPCDENHPNVAGCDYSSVAVSSAGASASAPTISARFSNANKLRRIREQMANRYRHP